MQDYPNQLFSAFAFIGFFIVLIPLRWHLQAWNVGTCAYMIWTALGCFVFAVNSVVWTDDVIVRAKVWCDISIRIQIAINTAIPAASLCINRRLYCISAVKSVTVTRSEKRRQMITDLLITVGIPVFQMIIFVIPQGHRGDIFEEVGPVFEFANTWVAYVLFAAWPVAIGLVSAVYAVLALINFAKRRATFRTLLSGNKNLNSSRYFRLMALSGMELSLTTPLAAWIMWFDLTKNPIQPWVSWENVHSDFNRFGQFPSIIWRSNANVEAIRELQRWSPVICAFVFFGFFGFADEARKHYREFASSVATKVGATGSFAAKFGLTSSTATKSTSSSGINTTLPVFITKEQSVFKSDFTTSSKTSTTFSLEEDFASLDAATVEDLKTRELSAPPTPVSDEKAAPAPWEELELPTISAPVATTRSRRESVDSLSSELDDAQARIAFSGSAHIV